MVDIYQIKTELVDRLDVYIRIINAEHDKEERSKWWERWYENAKAIEAVTKIISMETDK